MERMIWKPGPELGKYVVEVGPYASPGSIVGARRNEIAHQVRIVEIIESTHVRDYGIGSTRIAFLGELSNID